MKKYTTYKSVEHFYYGKRLKASILQQENNGIFTVNLYTYGKKVLNSLFLENYKKAVTVARNYLYTCKY